MKKPAKNATKAETTKFLREMKKERAKWLRDSGFESEFAGPIFVFGSNLAGIHGAGAAFWAKDRHGAKMGQGEGIQGSSYALPTKDENIESLHLLSVTHYVNRFLTLAELTPSVIYYLTKVGCGLANFNEQEIAFLFTTAPKNVLLINDEGDVVCHASDWLSRILNNKPR